MSAFGPKQTLTIAPHMSALGAKADMAFSIAKCPLIMHLAKNEKAKKELATKGMALE
jgi:hypothetical protein